MRRPPLLRATTFVEKQGGLFAPLLAAIGLAMLLGLPSQLSERIRIDENALSQRWPALSFSNSANASYDGEVHWNQRLVRGKRSPGSEIVAVYVNTEYTASVILANALIDWLRQVDMMGSDVQFYFVDLSSEWPTPRDYARAALILNISSLTVQNLCMDILAKHGIQPNQDLFAISQSHATLMGIKVSLLCPQPGNSSKDLDPTLYFFYALVNAMRISMHPKPWHSLPTKGISTLGISTNTPPTYMQRSQRNTISFVKFLAHLLVSLDSLEERFHHSTFVWLPSGSQNYVVYDVAQFCTLLFVASHISNAYANYQVAGLGFSPFLLLVCFSPRAAHMAYESFGLAGWVMTSFVISCWLARVRGNTAWLTANAVPLCLLTVLQPATGLLGGGATVIQLLLLHPRCRHWIFSVLGVALAWAMYYIFVGKLGMPMYGTNGVGVLFTSFLAYPNALWMTSKCLQRLLPLG